MTNPTTRQWHSLGSAGAALAAAEGELQAYRTGPDPAVRRCAGYRAMRHLDVALQAVSAVRTGLSGELRGAEVDRLAELEAIVARLSHGLGGAGYVREDPESDPTPDKPHEGWPLGGRRTDQADREARTRPIGRLIFPVAGRRPGWPSNERGER